MNGIGSYSYELKATCTAAWLSLTVLLCLTEAWAWELQRISCEAH